MRAYDVSFAWPTLRPQTFADLGAELVIVYTGNARPDQAWIDEARALGLGVAFCHEDGTEDWRTGYAGGLEKARRGRARAAERGYPDSCPILHAISDRNSEDPAAAWGVISEHARGIGDEGHDFIVYSNAYGIDAALAGSPRCLGGWCPSTWHMDASHLMIQHAGNPGTPYYNDAPPGSDLNTIQHPFAWWGADAAPAPIMEDFDMPYLAQSTGGTTLVLGAIPARVLTPAERDQYLALGLKAIPVTEDEQQALIAGPCPHGGGGPVTPSGSAQITGGEIHFG